MYDCVYVYMYVVMHTIVASVYYVPRSHTMYLIPCRVSLLVCLVEFVCKVLLISQIYM